VPFAIVATAPSMDGFASHVTPLIRKGLKITFPAHTPKIIIGDLRLLETAPRVLVAAGIADVLGKINSLVDWKIGAIVTGEYYCPWVASVMRLALTRVIDLAESGGDLTLPLMEALTLAGLAMSFANETRPAAGIEHHIAHTWEMIFLNEGRKLVPHGVKVGIGTVLAMQMAQQLRCVDILNLNPPHPIAHDTWISEMRRVFGPASVDIINLELKVRKNDVSNMLARRESAVSHWPEIIALLEGLPSPEEIVSLLKLCGGASSPSDIGLTDDYVRDAMLYAKEQRYRFTIQQLAYDIGVIP